MKKGIVLAALVIGFALIVSGAAISADMSGGTDKAAALKIKADILKARKAALGSAIPPIGEAQILTINRTRAGNRLIGREEVRVPGGGLVTEGYKQDDEEPDDTEECISEGSAFATNSFYGDLDEDWYCLDNLCEGTVIQIDIDSHKMGAPTDLFVEVYDDCDMTPIACRDDGNGFSGVTTDTCIMVTAPLSGKIWWRVVNLCDSSNCLDPNGGDCTYEMSVTVSSITETEDNNSFPGEDFLYTLEPPEWADELSDEDTDEFLCYRPDDDGFVAALIDPADDTDKFRVCLHEGEILHVGVEAGKCNNLCDGFLFDPTMDLYYYDPVADSYDPVATADDIDGVDPGFFYMATYHGEYVIDFYEWGGDGDPENLYYLYATIFQGHTDASDTCAGAECFNLVPEVCPCNGFKNHGGYVVCVVRYAKGLKRAGLITQKEYSDMVSEAAQSDCSKPAAPSGKGDHSGWDGSSKNKDIPKP